MNNTFNRRNFLYRSLAVAGAGYLPLQSVAGFTADSAAGKENSAGAGTLPWKVGAVSYGFEYSIGLFRSKKRTGPRMDVHEFLEATKRAGGDVAQIHFTQVEGFDLPALEKVRDHAKKLDILPEYHGGSALNPNFEQLIVQAVALGSKFIGCTFGMLMRPNKISSLEQWDQHMEKCSGRLRELVRAGEEKGVIIAVENHLDFTVKELHDLVASMQSPYAGVLFDIGNTIGTLDDPVTAANLLGPYIVATHYKDFAIEETARGFRFTMVPLGAGSLNLEVISKALVKHMKPGAGLSIELINGQQFEVNWLEDRFWDAYRGKTAREVALTLSHIRSSGIDIKEYLPESELNLMSHEEIWQLEFDRMQKSITYLRRLLRDINEDRK